MLIKMVGTWIRLAHVELSSGASTIDSGTFTKTKNLQFVIFTVGGASCKQTVQFNGDSSGSAGSSGNYFYRTQTNHDSYSDSVNQVRLMIQGTSTTGNAYSETKVVNVDGQEKQIHLSSMECADGVTNDPDRYKGIGKWTTTSGQIESIKVLSDTGNNFGVGSYITVFGDGDDVISDEKTTLADATVTTESSPTTSTTNNGTETNGATNANRVEVNQLTETIPAGAVITKIRVKYRADESSTNTKLVLYQDNGSTTPTTLLAYTAQFNPNVSDGWYEANIAYDGSGSSASSYTVTSSTAGRLWVGIWADGDSSIYKSSGTQKSMSLTYSGSTTAPTSTFSVSDTYSVDYNFGIVSTTTTTSSSAPPVNTRYEETDTRKIYRKVDPTTPTYTPDMTSDTNWLDTVSARIDNNTSTGKIDFDVHRTDTNQALSYDLGTALSNTAWTLRYKMTVDTITQVSDANRMFMGMRSISASSNASTNSDFIGWHSKVGRTGGGADFKEFHYMTTDGSSMDIEGTTSSVVPTTTTYYITITRKTATTWSLRISTSADYTGGTLHDDISCASGTQGLQYLWIGNVGVSGGSSARFMGTIEDVKIYNGSASFDEWKERGTA